MNKGLHSSTVTLPHSPQRRAGLAAVLGWSALALAGCAGLPGPATEPPAPTPPRWRPPRLGLALGGGAARGFAHIGVIQVLEAAGLRPDLVVGTSAGSLVAALYASGMDGQALEAAALQMEEVAIADWTLPLFNRGVLRGEALARYVNRQVNGRLLQDMALPLGILATDLASGQGVLFQRGDTGTAVRASSAVPGVFLPVSIEGRDYVDGGLVAPVPVPQARQMGAEVVLAVDISSPPQGQATGDVLRVMLQTFNIMGQSLNRHLLDSADVVLRPRLDGVGSANFNARQQAMAAGRAAMQAALPRLREQMVAQQKRASPG